MTVELNTNFNKVVTKDPWLNVLPKNGAVQRGLLILSVACGILTLIPPLRVAGSVAARAVAFISSVHLCSDKWHKEDMFGRIIKCATVAGVMTGIVAIAASFPLLITISLIMDIAAHTFAIIKVIKEEGFSQGGFQGLLHLSIIVVDILTLSAMLLGSWELLVAAAAVSVVAMVSMAIYAVTQQYRAEEERWAISADHVPKSIQGHDADFVYWKSGFIYEDHSVRDLQGWGNVVDMVCYLALAALGIVSAVKMTPSYRDYGTNAKFTYKNDSQDVVILTDEKNNIVGRVQPGETFDLDLPHGREVSVWHGYVQNNGGVPPLRIHYFSKQSILEFFSDKNVKEFDKSSINFKPENFIYPQIDFVTKEVEPPMPVTQFPSAFVGGPNYPVSRYFKPIRKLTKKEIAKEEVFEISPLPMDVVNIVGDFL